MYLIIPHVTRYISLLSSGFVPKSADPHTALRMQDHYIEALLPVQSENTELVDKPLESSSNLTQNLPPEILGHIFIYCLPELSAAPNSATRDLVLQLLIQVCKRWQTVTARMPQLWMMLGLHGLCNVDPISLISTALRRSSALPLNIYINPLTWSYTPCCVVPRAMQLLAHALPRCRTLHTTNFPALLEHLLPAGSCIMAPHLRNLHITAAPKSVGHMLHGRLAAPVLTMLLCMCPCLEMCTIVRPTAVDADADGSRVAISLPHLHCLSLLGTVLCDIVLLLCHLDVPMLEHVCLQVEPMMSSGLACILDSLFPDAAAAPLGPQGAPHRRPL